MLTARQVRQNPGQAWPEPRQIRANPQQVGPDLAKLADSEPHLAKFVDSGLAQGQIGPKSVEIAQFQPHPGELRRKSRTTSLNPRRFGRVSAKSSGPMSIKLGPEHDNFKQIRGEVFSNVGQESKMPGRCQQHRCAGGRVSRGRDALQSTSFPLLGPGRAKYPLLKGL